MKRDYTRNWPNVNYYRLYVIYLTLFIFFLPFIWWPYAVIAYEIPRVWYVLIGIDIAAVAGIVLFKNSLPKLGTLVPIKIMGLFLFVGIVSALTGTDLQKSIMGNPFRLDGLITLLHLACFAAITALLDDTGRRSLIAAAGISSWVLSVIVSLTWIAYLSGYPIPTLGGTIGSTFGQPNFLAGFLVVTMPFIWYVFPKTVFRAAMIVPLIAILATGAKGGMAGAMLFAVLLAGDLPQFAGARVRKIVSAAGIIGIVLLIWYSIWSASQIPQQVLAESRQRIFTKGLIAFTRRPVLGWGWSNYDHAFAAVDWPYHFRFDAYVDKAHSNGLEILVTTGITGFAVYAVFLLLLYRALSRPEKKSGEAMVRKILLWSFLLYLFHSQTNVTSIAEEMIFWLVAGYAMRIRTT